LKDLENGWCILLKALIYRIKEIKENNEKILKRFEFDLEMGVFNQDAISKLKAYYFEPIDRKKFIKILEAVGYKYSKAKIKIYDKPEGIAVIKDSKKYWLCYYSFDWFPINDNINLIPSYIFGYSTNPVLDAIKETIHVIFKRKVRT